MREGRLAQTFLFRSGPARRTNPFANSILCSPLPMVLLNADLWTPFRARPVAAYHHRHLSPYARLLRRRLLITARRLALAKWRFYFLGGRSTIEMDRLSWNTRSGWHQT